MSSTNSTLLHLLYSNGDKKIAFLCITVCLSSRVTMFFNCVSGRAAVHHTQVWKTLKPEKRCLTLFSMYLKHDESRLQNHYINIHFALVLSPKCRLKILPFFRYIHIDDKTSIYIILTCAQAALVSYVAIITTSLFLLQPSGLFNIKYFHVYFTNMT